MLLKDLKEGEYFRFEYESINTVRYVCQKGKQDSYCPKITDPGPHDSGQECYALDANVVKLNDEKVIKTISY